MPLKNDHWRPWLGFMAKEWVKMKIRSERIRVYRRFHSNTSSTPILTVMEIKLENLDSNKLRFEFSFKWHLSKINWNLESKDMYVSLKCDAKNIIWKALWPSRPVFCTKPRAPCTEDTNKAINRFIGI